MGRRIPGKKHKGVKDPLVQQAKRFELLKDKINAPPKNLDQQEIPKSVERLMKLKQMTKDGVFNKRKNKKVKSKLMDTSKLTDKERILPGMSKPDRDLPKLVQRPGESNRAFLHRVHLATTDFIKEVKFEVKHNMKMKKDEKTGQVRFDKIEMHPVDKMFQDKLAATTQKKKRKKKVLPAEEELSKTAKRRLRQQERKEQINKMEGASKREEFDGFERLKDEVAFNEVVHRPPQLTSLPRRAIVDPESRHLAGNKPGLLLARVLGAGAGKTGLTGKRKELSHADRLRLDSARVDAVNAYRQLKLSKATSSVR